RVAAADLTIRDRRGPGITPGPSFFKRPPSRPPHPEIGAPAKSPGARRWFVVEIVAPAARAPPPAILPPLRGPPPPAIRPRGGDAPAHQLRGGADPGADRRRPQHPRRGERGVDRRRPGDRRRDHALGAPGGRRPDLVADPLLQPGPRDRAAPRRRPLPPPPRPAAALLRPPQGRRAGQHRHQRRLVGPPPRRLRRPADLQRDRRDPNAPRADVG